MPKPKYADKEGVSQAGLPHDDFDEFSKNLRFLLSECHEIANSQPAPRIKEYDSYKDLATKITDLEKKLVRCEESLQKDRKKLTEDISVASDITKKKLLQMELRNKEIYMKIVTKERENLYSEKFNLMEKMQRLRLITTKDSEAIPPL